MTYIFMMRDNKSAKSVEVAKAIVKSGVAVMWDGKLGLVVRNWLRGQRFYSLGGSFDEKNLVHWKALPDLVIGSRFWVVKKNAVE